MKNSRTNQWTRAALMGIIAMVAAATAQAQSVFISELHYDNDGGDLDEGFEISGPAGTDLTGWTVVLYNGNGGGTYNTINLSGSIDDEGSGFGALWFGQAANTIQNGSPDGLVLVDAGSNVIQLISYEGSINAVGGPADGQTLPDIGVSEPSNNTIGDTLQLTGTGLVLGDFTWTGPTPNSRGTINAGLTLSGGGVDYVVNGSTTISVNGVDQADGPFVRTIEIDAINATVNIDSAVLAGSGLWAVSGVPASVASGTTDTITFTYTPTANDGATAAATVPVLTSGNNPTSFTVTLSGTTLFDTDIATVRSEFEAGTAGSKVYRITGTVGANNILSSSRNQFAIQDRTDGDAATRGIVVDDSGATGLGSGGLPEIGEQVTVIGSPGQFRGLVQFVPNDAYTTASGTVPTPVVVTLADLGDDTEGVLLRLNGLDVPAGAYNPSTNISGITDGTGATDRVVRLDDDFPGSFTALDTTFYDVIGLGGQFDFTNPDAGGSGYQVFPRFESDILTNTVPVELSGFSVE